MVRERLMRQRLRLLSEKPFFGTLLLHAPLRETTEVPTMATDGYAIYYNPHFVEELTDDMLLAVLLHEVLHAAYSHLPRRGGRDPRRWNIAADIVVNGIVEQEGVGQLPEGAVRDRSLEHLPVEEVYVLLKEPPSLEPPDLLEEPPERYESLDEPVLSGSGALEPHDEDGAGEEASPPQQAPGAAPADLGAYWRQAINKASVAAQSEWGSKSQGVEPLGAHREVRQALEARLDWRSLLWRFLTPTPTDFSGLDRRFVHRRQYFEALEEWNVRAHIAVDTSGSIGRSELESLLGEVRGILQAYPRTEALLYYADAEVYGPYPLQLEGDWPKPQGGGGTDFRPFFEKVSEDDTLGEILAIYLTDGYGSFPKESPAFQVLWVVKPGGLADEGFPFGEVARLWD
jgi:predicted metal-dependent peptidase